MSRLRLLAALVLPVPLAVRAWTGDCAIEGTVQSPVKAIAGHCAPGRYAGQGRQSADPPPVASVAVYLEGSFTQPGTVAPAPVQLTQKGLQFVPAVLPVRRGERVEFPNRDDEYHNVLSYSRAKEFDLGRYLKGERAPSVVFDKPGIVEVNCEIHDHMRAYILVLDTPYFTTTDAGGRFRMDHLPAGKHVLKAWASPKVSWQLPVVLTEGSVTRVEFPPPKEAR